MLALCLYAAINKQERKKTLTVFEPYVKLLCSNWDMEYKEHEHQTRLGGPNEMMLLICIVGNVGFSSLRNTKELKSTCQCQ